MCIQSDNVLAQSERYINICRSRYQWINARSRPCCITVTNFKKTPNTTTLSIHMDGSGSVMGWIETDMLGILLNRARTMTLERWRHGRSNWAQLQRLWAYLNQLTMEMRTNFQNHIQPLRSTITRHMDSLLKSYDRDDFPKRSICVWHM